jgi:hypothetical protein
MADDKDLIFRQEIQHPNKGPLDTQSVAWQENPPAQKAFLKNISCGRHLAGT